MDHADKENDNYFKTQGQIIHEIQNAMKKHILHPSQKDRRYFQQNHRRILKSNIRDASRGTKAHRTANNLNSKH